MLDTPVLILTPQVKLLGWLHSTEVAYLLLTSSSGFDSQHSQNFFRRKIIKLAVVSLWRWLEESGQRLENADRTHLVLACGEPVLQKMCASMGRATLGSEKA